MAWAQVKNPYADYDLRPRPMAWAQVMKIDIHNKGLLLAKKSAILKSTFINLCNIANDNNY